jgi:hypothetical protein
MALAGTSSSQEPQPKEKPGEPKTKLPALLASNPLKADPADNELRRLLKARYNEAVSEAKAFYMEEPFIDRIDTQDALYGRWQRVVQAGLELCDKPADKVTLLSQYVDVAKELEQETKSRCDAGRLPIYHLHRARYQRLDAEIQLMRARRDAENPKDKR